MKKTTMQDIADALSTSRVSVWKVLTGQPGVSDALRRQVLAKAEELGYVNPKLSGSPAQRPRPAKAGVTFSVVVARPESSVFWMNIIHQIAKELNKLNISLMYTYVPSQADPCYQLPPALTNGSVQGMIVMNVYSRHLLQKLDSLDIPRVFLDTVPDFPPERLTGDVVLLEGRSPVYEITSSLIRRGRTRIGFIGDIHYAQTNRERYEGYVQAMKDHGLELPDGCCLARSIGIHSYGDEICAFLESIKELPEAFICVSDFVAHFVVQYLNEKSCRIPEDVAVSGYDNIKDYIDMNELLTTVDVDFISLGKRLVQQLLWQMQNPDSPHEVIRVSSSPVYRHSTDC